MRAVNRLLLGGIASLAALRAVGFLVYAWDRFPLPIEAWHLEAKMVHLAWRAQAGIRLYPPWRDDPHVNDRPTRLFRAQQDAVQRSPGWDWLRV
jgi:hypothetical protein